MATSPLTRVARRASQDQLPAPSDSWTGRDWRAVLTKEDAEEIWTSLLALAKASICDHARQEHITQELFLHLIVTGKFRLYVAEDYANEEILQDLLSLLDR